MTQLLSYRIHCPDGVMHRLALYLQVEEMPLCGSFLFGLRKRYCSRLDSSCSLRIRKISSLYLFLRV